jgi:hypothetical protein
MSGHVAQAFTTDDEWTGLLADIKRALVAGGTLAFDSLDPETKAWERWAGRIEGELPGGGKFASRASVTVVDGEIVTFEVDTVLPDGERRSGVSDYRFRPAPLLRQSVEDVGFAIEAMWGGWHEEPVGAGRGEVVVVATA